jgi:RNA polymerase sigma-70 factor (ECF subfamily)
MSAAGSGFAGLDDARLVPRIRAGDAAAYRYLYEIALPPLLRFAFHIIGSRDAAEDAVQSVLVEIWVNREQWQPSGSLLAYLYRGVRNHILDSIRHDRVVERAEAIMDTEYPYGMGAAPASADVLVESSDVVDTLAAAIQRLPERQRTTVLLRWYDGMTTAAVADVMGISRQVAEKLLAKAHAKLRVTLQNAHSD